MNVKAVEPLAAGEEVVSYRVRPNLPALGPKYGKQLGAIRAALAASDPNEVARHALAGEPFKLLANVTLEADETARGRRRARGVRSNGGGWLLQACTRAEPP